MREKEMEYMQKSQDSERERARNGEHHSSWLVKRLNNLRTHGLAENEGGRKNERSGVLVRGGGLTD